MTPNTSKKNRRVDIIPVELVRAGLRMDRSSTAEKVADLLRELIISGDLVPGTPLHEQQLVGSLEVSRNTLREAFRLLAHERLVVYRLHRGVTVRELDERDLRDIYRTREALELMAIDYGARSPMEAVGALLEIVELAEVAALSDDWKRVATLNIAFHQRLVDLIGSERVSTFFRAVEAELRLVLAPFEHVRDFYGPFISRNRVLVECLLAGDRAAAAAELKAYLAESERLRVELFQS